MTSPVGKSLLFSTSWMNAGKELAVMASALQGKGAAVIGNYHCKGKTSLIFNRGHPDQSDLASGKKFRRIWQSSADHHWTYKVSGATARTIV